MNPADERTWAGAAHWSALVASVVGFAFLGPLLVMLTKGNESPWVRRQAVESLNFQLSVLIYGAAGFVIGLVLTGITLGLALVVLIPAALALGVAWLVLTIIGAVRAANGEDYRDPLTIRMAS